MAVTPLRSVSGHGVKGLFESWRSGGFSGSIGSRGKFDVMSVPPWKRWPRKGILRIHHNRIPDVQPSIDIATCEDPELVADTICEVVPWKRLWKHHPWLHSVCGKIRQMLPSMSPRDSVRVTLAFSELYTKRKPHKLLFYDYETYAQLFQAIPLDVVTSKTLVPLMRAYWRMEVKHEPFVKAVCERVISGEVELRNAELVELVRIHGHIGLMSPRLFDFVLEVLDLKFAYFSEDHIGDLARAFVKLRYRSIPFADILRRELPYRLHEYSWWNVIDIAEMYLELEIKDRDIIERIGNESFKLIYSMKYGYPAKTLKVLAFLETGDKKTYRMLLRSIIGRQHSTTHAIAESILACSAIGVEPSVVYHKTRGERIYRSLSQELTPKVSSLSTKMTCDVFAALAHVGQPEPELMRQVEKLVKQRPFKFHAEHIISMLRDFAKLGHRSPDMRAVLAQRSHQLSECTPSGLCALPGAIQGHMNILASKNRLVELGSPEAELLSTACSLMCQPGAYTLPSDARVFRSKDDFWWKQLKQRHFRLRKRAKEIGAGVDPAPIGMEDERTSQSAAVFHITRSECLQLVCSLARLDWRDEPLLDGLSTWLCMGRRHADLTANEVSSLLGALSSLGYTNSLLRAALEHALLRVAAELSAADCLASLKGALDLGMGVRSAAVCTLLRRCTSQIGLIPIKDVPELNALSATIRSCAEQEVLDVAQSTSTTASRTLTRLPLDLHLFGEAVASRLERTKPSYY